jgi:hypothetical protein
MARYRAALTAVIAASWLAIIGGMLIAWWLFLGGHLGHLVFGGISLGVAVEVGVFALNLTERSRR